MLSESRWYTKKFVFGMLAVAAPIHFAAITAAGDESDALLVSPSVARECMWRVDAALGIHPLTGLLRRVFGASFGSTAEALGVQARRARQGGTP